MAEFVHLHNHTEYSLLDGMLRISSTKPGSFLQTLAEKKVPAMAMTDHGNMYGAREFYKNAKTVGIKPIIGCEFYITPLKYTEIGEEKVKNNHITVLAKNLQGYNNLMTLNSTAWVDGFYYKPRIDFDLLQKHKEGLIILSGCVQGLLAQTALNKSEEDAIKLVLKYRDTFGPENYYIEIMDHGIPEEQSALKVLLEVSKKTGIPLVATNDCHYEKREDWQAHDIHICIATDKTLDDPKRFKMNTHELFFKSPEEMEKLFSFAPDALKNTLAITEKCNLELKEDGFVMPDFPIPAEFENHAEYLRHCCITGLKKKLKTDNIPTEYMQRLDYELKVIIDMGFAVYFLIVADFIRYARSQDIPIGPGRGSGAGSLVAYSMDITRVDPLVNKLLFERFLNPDRVSMPDLDIDISDAGREEVINYMRRKYGIKNVASIITFGTMKAKLALKDTARVMGFEPSEANRLSKLIPDDLKATISGAMETNPEIKSEMSKNPKVKQLFNYATKIEGLKRHTGVHASGVLVTKEEVTKYTPLAKGSKDIITTQYEGNTVSDMGLLKIDFLGLRTLTVIDNAVKLIKKLRGIDIDIANIPTNDKKTFELLDKAETTCVFQLESGGMKDLVRRMHPSVFSDISALVALYRPGPMQSGMLDSFVKRKNGQEKITFEHKLLEPILSETYGTLIYQEQIMETAKRLSGFTPGEADTLRKAMGKKKMDIMEKFRPKFIEGGEKNGVSAKLTTKLFDQMAKFAEYGFNKSHSVAYALVAYQTAYLKANYPIEFMCSALTNEIGHNAIGSADKENKIATYLEEARKMGFEILPPDIQHSEATFSVEKTQNGKEAIRIGLMAIKNLGEECCCSIVKTRQEGGNFKDFLDVCSRIDLETANKRCFECLIKAGAFDSLYQDMSAQESRAMLLANFEMLVDKANLINKEKENASQSLFGEEIINVVGAKEVKLKPAAPLSKALLLNYEKDVLGIYLSGHPLAKYERYLNKLVKMKISDIERNSIRGHVEVAGIVSRLKKRQNKNKENWAQIVLEDEEQSIFCNIYSRTWANLNGKINVNDIVLISGDIRGDESAANPEIVVSSAHPLLNVFSSKAKKMFIYLSSDLAQEKLFELENLLNAAKGFCEVELILKEGENQTRIHTPKRIMIHKALVDFIDDNYPLISWDFE
jgi:DNA-directed DNA polymerase III (polc)